MKSRVRFDAEGAYVDINDFADLYDITKIAFYTLEEIDGDLKLMFYNKNKRLLKPKKPKKTKKSLNENK